MMDWRARGLLLDFYGTVVQEDHAIIGSICAEIVRVAGSHVDAADVGRCWSESFRQTCAAAHGPAFRTQAEIEHESLIGTLERFECPLDAGALSLRLVDYWSRPLAFPNAREVLAEVRLPVCLVSNIDSEHLRLALAHVGLRFAHTVTSEDCRAYKPRPEMFRRALALLGLGAHEVLHVGDSFGSDMRGAQALGIRTAWVNRRGRSLPAAAPPPDWTGSDLGVLRHVPGIITP